LTSKKIVNRQLRQRSTKENFSRGHASFRAETSAKKRLSVYGRYSVSTRRCRICIPALETKLYGRNTVR
ncbi:MAG: hypothetical protein ABIJ27_00315, partial [Candidatus Omnitrophota bacterium]